MIELIRSDIYKRILLVESMSKHIKESKLFTSAFDNFEDDFKTTSFRVIGDFPNYGYKIVREFSKGFPNGVDRAYTLDNEWIGRVDEAKYLCEKRGLRLEKSKPDSCCCSIGKCIYLPEEHEDFGKWFGFSHRAIYGFKVGDGYEVREGDCLEGYFPIGYKAKTEADCRSMAIAFADSVS